jgi:hypothetical protein
VVVGVVISFWITYGTRNMDGEISLRLPLRLQMVCTTMVGLTMNFFPFSPRWLAMVDRPEDALSNLAKLRRLPQSDERVQTEFRGIMAERQFRKIVQERRHPGVTGFERELLSWGDLFDRKLWRRLAVGCGVQFFQQFSGINAFIYYAPTLSESLGQSIEIALIISGIFNILQLVAITVCLVIIDNVGRRPLAILGAVGAATAWAVMAGLVGAYSTSWAEHPDAGWGAVAMAFLFILVFGVSYAPRAGRCRLRCSQAPCDPGVLLWPLPPTGSETLLSVSFQSQDSRVSLLPS